MASHSKYWRTINGLLDESRECFINFGNKQRDLSEAPITIELFLASNLDYLNSAIDLLVKGYPKLALAQLRPVSEGMILSAFLFEFPEEAGLVNNNDHDKLKKKYRKLGYDGLAGIAHYIDEKGNKFDQTEGSTQFVDQIIDSYAKESNAYVHQNQKHIKELKLRRDPDGREALHIGPHYSSERVVELLSIKIEMAAISNLWLIYRIFGDLIDDRLIKSSPALIKTHNKRYESYQKKYR